MCELAKDISLGIAIPEGFAPKYVQGAETRCQI